MIRRLQGRTRLLDLIKYMLRWCPEKVIDHGQELALGVGLEERAAGDHLDDDTAHGPHIHRCPIVGVIIQELRGAVPQGDDLGGQGGDLLLVMLAEIDAPGQTKVCQLHIVAVADQDIGTLQVPASRAGTTGSTSRV